MQASEEELQTGRLRPVDREEDPPPVAECDIQGQARLRNRASISPFFHTMISWSVEHVTSPKSGKCTNICKAWPSGRGSSHRMRSYAWMLQSRESQMISSPTCEPLAKAWSKREQEHQ
ncbi:hypothetical protein JZ751_011837 [Albula glossodonta]|uniref:Uncharacterized protein n=1 Tax=Albula glossodonta TaxID=121402 RepID=A0A8T2PQT5_9TELE|nr:hypothetical protein JZ751_011837 [Albula glossodonta]